MLCLEESRWWCAAMVKLEKAVVLHSEDLVLSLWSQKLTLSVLYKPGNFVSHFSLKVSSFNICNHGLNFSCMIQLVLHLLSVWMALDVLS